MRNQQKQRTADGKKKDYDTVAGHLKRINDKLRRRKTEK